MVCSAVSAVESGFGSWNFSDLFVKSLGVSNPRFCTVGHAKHNFPTLRLNSYGPLNPESDSGQPLTGNADVWSAPCFRGPG